MARTFLALCQFTYKGESITTYMQHHDDDISALYASLPNLYCAVFVIKNGTRVAPLGGLLFKSNVPRDRMGLANEVRNFCLTLQPVASLVTQTDKFMLVPIKEHDTTVPTERDCIYMVNDACLSVGVEGNA